MQLLRQNNVLRKAREKRIL